MFLTGILAGAVFCILIPLILSPLLRDRVEDIELAERLYFRPGQPTLLYISGVTKTGRRLEGESLFHEFARTGVTIEVSSPDIAIIDDDGYVIPKQLGTTELSIYDSKTGLSAGALLIVDEKLEGFQMSNILASTEDNMVQLNYKPIPETADPGAVTATVEDSSIAYINEMGYLIPVSSGQTTVTIRSNKGVSKTVNLIVTKRPTAIFADELTVEVGETKKINVYTDVKDFLPEGADGTLYDFFNGNNAVCAVSIHGDVTGISLGDSTVKVVNEHGLETTTTVHVVSRTSKIVFESTHSDDPVAEDGTTEPVPTPETVLGP